MDWKNLDVSLYDDDDDDDGDDDDGGDDGDGPADPNAPLRPEDVGLPPRLASWLVRHRCGDVRRARDAIGRRSSRSKRTTTPDADGHVALGGARPKYAPLHERPPAKVLPCARPMPRDDDFEPPDVVARRRALEGAFYVTLVPIRPRRRGERRSLRTFSPGASLRPGSLAFNPDTPRCLSTPPDAFQLHPDVRSKTPAP